MIGSITQPNDFPLESPSSKIYLLDITNYTWVGTFPENITESSNPPNPSTSSVKNSPTQTTTNTSLIAIVTISAILGTAILMAIGYCCYKWRRARNQNLGFLPKGFNEHVSNH